MVDTSSDYLQRLRSGEEPAWGDLHREHYPRLWSSVQRILNNPTLADDVVQEAFIKAHRDIRRFEGNSQLGTWLYRIAINQALDTIRKRQRTESVALVPLAYRRGRKPDRHAGRPGQAGGQHRAGERGTAGNHFCRDGRIECRASGRGATAVGRRNEPGRNGTTPAMQARYGEFEATLCLRAPSTQVDQAQKAHRIRNLDGQKERKKKKRKTELFRFSHRQNIVEAAKRQPLNHLHAR